MNQHLRLLLFFCFCLLAVSTVSAQTQDHYVWVSGQVVKQVDKTPIAGKRIAPDSI